MIVTVTKTKSIKFHGICPVLNKSCFLMHPSAEVWDQQKLLQPR